MPVPHDYYGHHSPEPQLHNRHNAAPYIEPDWQANLAKDQLPDISTIGRGPKGDGILIGDIRQNNASLSFDILSDLTGEVISTIGPFPTGSIKVFGDKDHDPVAGEVYKFYVEHNAYNEETGKVETITNEIPVPPGATGSLIYLYDEILDRTKDDTYQIDEDDLIIYNKQKYPNKPHVRVNDIVFLQTHKRVPPTKERKAHDEYYLTFGTVEAVEKGKVIFTARTFYRLNAIVSWDDIENKPEWHKVAFSGDYNDLENSPLSKTDDGWVANDTIGVSIFNNDKEYQTKSEVQVAINSAVSAAYRYKGIVDSYEDLPGNAENGWVYHVNQEHEGVPAGTNWAWDADGNHWDALGGEVNFDGIATEEYVGDAINNAVASLSPVATSGSFNDLIDTPTDHVYRVDLSQEEYDALETLDPYAIYVIDGGDSPIPSFDISWDDIKNKPLFATVAATGNYNDLSNLPEFKTINNQSILGTGNISVEGGSADITYATDAETEAIVDEIVAARS